MAWKIESEETLKRFVVLRGFDYEGYLGFDDNRAYSFDTLEDAMATIDLGTADSALVFDCNERRVVARWR